ncbi:hypothetical protein ACFSF3_25965 [Vibrio chagasii]
MKTTQACRYVVAQRSKETKGGCASDEEDGAQAMCGLTHGLALAQRETHRDGYYAISGTDVVLTQAGVDAVNAGEDTASGEPNGDR